MTEKYSMTISLNILHHLGINLYSNSVAVITETVANSYDADANEVNVEINPTTNTITITDDGIGMDINEINNRFLNIGYDRRKYDGKETTIKGRPIMGRKGLGKLSLFSIARKIEIYSKKNGITNAFCIDVADIEKKIEESGETESFEYNPKEISFIPNNVIATSTGTKIVLSDLKKTRITSVSQLRARLARRFSVIGKKYGFIAQVNGQDIAISERKFFKKLQYVWVFGDQSYQDEIKKQCGPNLKRFNSYSENIEGTADNIRGWIATVDNSGDLNDPDSGNLNNIILLSRGRIIHENILDAFSDGRLYTKYIIGEINADFLDVTSKSDIATSSRQSLVEDDERYSILTSHLKKILDVIANNWTNFRNEDGANEAAKSFPAVEEWLATFKTKKDTQKAANKIIGHIQSLPVDNIEDKKDLLRHGIIAFERLRLNDELKKLDALLSFDSEQFKGIVDNVDELEASLYYTIVKERVEIIRTLEKLSDTNALEKEIQSHIFEHLWLLDPSWERATGTEVMEQSVAKEFGKITALTQEELKGRLDIRYKKSAGSHVIIELKRSSVDTKILDLYAQGRKYKTGLTKCLQSHGELNPAIEIIFLTGDQPQEEYDNENINLFRSLNARLLTYKQIVQSSLKSYTDYLEEHKKAGALREILSKL